MIYWQDGNLLHGENQVRNTVGTLKKISAKFIRYRIIIVDGRLFVGMVQN